MKEPGLLSSEHAAGGAADPGVSGSSPHDPSPRGKAALFTLMARRSSSYGRAAGTGGFFYTADGPHIYRFIVSTRLKAETSPFYMPARGRLLSAPLTPSP
ncbi:MAG: hypothetical protein ACLTYN_02320 [Dysosmobacter welbionis]